MLAMAVYFVKPLIPGHEQEKFILALIALAAGVHLGFTSNRENNAQVRHDKKNSRCYCNRAISPARRHCSFTWPGCVVAAILSGDVCKGNSRQKTVIIDFYADWCTPCRELDKKTFHDKDVVKESEKFSMIKVDLTKEANPDVLQLLKKYDVKGVPTVTFLIPVEMK